MCYLCIVKQTLSIMENRINFKQIAEANGFDLQTNKGRKEFARLLSSMGVKRYELRCKYEGEFVWLDVYPYQIIDAFDFVESEAHFIETYGEEGKAYVEVYDECLDMLGSHHFYFDDWSNRTHNRHAESLDWDYPCVYSFSVYNSGTYNESFQLKNFRTYNERYANVEEFGIDGVRLATKLLKEKIEEETAYRKRMRWKGELDIEGLASELQSMYPKLEIVCRSGKRQCDGDCEPYKAIVVYDEGSQCGSVTLSINEVGICGLTRRVPLSGESSWDVTNEDVMDSLRECVEFMS